MAAQSHVGISFQIPEYSSSVNAQSSIKLFEAVKSFNKDIRIYQACTSEMFGDTPPPQSIQSPFSPQSPYAISKVFTYEMAQYYKKAYNMFISCGILFNHESFRRGNNFVTKKIVNGLEAVSAGRQECLTLGNLTALRDWGHAKDYVEAMWLMLQQDKPEDFVIATGEQYTVKQFVDLCAPYFALKIRWEGEGLNEVGINTLNNKVIVKVDPKYFRPAEVQTLLGDSSKARSVLGWKPKHGIYDLVEDMCMNFE